MPASLPTSTSSTTRRQSTRRPPPQPWSTRTEGQRVRKTTASTSVDFLYDLAGNQITELSSSGAWNRSEVYGGGRHLATYSGGTSGTTYFIHVDWLGTERARSTAAGSSYETCTSLPFGDALTCSGSDPSPMHFTGKERDSESGLDNFDTRYLGSSFGRFMSPGEPLVGQYVSEPQSWNAYAYVRNNPINATDPDGQDCVYVNDNSVSVLRGDCERDTDNGIFINGTIDIKSGSYDRSTGTLSFNYTNDDTGALGKGVIGDVYPSSGVSAADRLNAVAQGTRMAGPAVNLLARGLQLFGNIVALGVMTGAQCLSDGCSKGDVAMANLPALSALREGATLLKEGAAVGKAAEILQKGGGMAKAAKDFESLQGAEKVYGSTRVKELADGTKAVLYESKGGRATIALQDTAGRTVTKIRY